MALKILPFLKISFALFRPVEKYFSMLVRRTIRRSPDNLRKLSKEELTDLYFQIANMGELTDEQITCFLGALRLVMAELRRQARRQQGPQVMMGQPIAAASMQRARN